MLKRTITYEDFNGDTVTETFYFNLSKSELIEMETGQSGGLQRSLERIIEAQDARALIDEFKKIILASYGIKSEDGRRFIKSNELREAFSQTAAYDALFMELSTDEGAAEKFIKGIIPSDLTAEMNKPSVPSIPTAKE